MALKGWTMVGVQVEGSSVACLVAADVLARSGVPVRLTATGALGRSFSPVVVDGQRLELGPRLLELRYEDPEPRPVPDVLEYAGGDHRPWMGHIREYIFGLVEPRPVRLCLQRCGYDTVDFLLTGDLASLPTALNAQEKRDIEEEVLVALRCYPNGVTAGELARMTYRGASSLLHGRIFHALFIEPLIDAVVGPNGDVPALDHRKVWLPLFRPLEILQGLWGESKRYHRTMWLGMTEAVGELVERVAPLRGADLPPGERDYIFDSPPVEGAEWLDLLFSWAPADEAESVTWLYRGPTAPYRRTVVNGVACLEAGPASRWTDELVAVRVPLATPPVAPRAGVIGAGSFNEQILQGLACAAWRLR